MKVLIAIHQCHYDDKAGKRMVAEPMEQFEASDQVADVLIKAGAAKEAEKATAKVVEKDDKPAAKDTKGSAKGKSKGKSKDEPKDEPKADAEGEELV